MSPRRPQDARAERPRLYAQRFEFVCLQAAPAVCAASGCPLCQLRLQVEEQAQMLEALLRVLEEGEGEDG